MYLYFSFFYGMLNCRNLFIWLIICTFQFLKSNMEGFNLKIRVILNLISKIIYININIMNITLILFLIGILGFMLNRKNIILMLISIEIMLLSITFLILISSLNIDDIIGQTYAIYIIVVAGAESAIGLGILVAFYRLRGSIAIEYK